MADHTYTFGDQLDLLTILLGDPNVTADDMFPLAIRKTYLNRGELQFAKHSKCLTEYVAGNLASGVITVPTDWLKTHVLLVDGRKADNLEIALQDYERYEASGDYYWYYWMKSGAKLINFVNPSSLVASYKLWYFKKPITNLSDTDDTSELPIEYREASAYWAGSVLMKQIGKTELSAQYLNMYSELVAIAISDTKEQYMDRVNPNVDVGDNDSYDTVDRQGHGRLY